MGNRNFQRGAKAAQTPAVVKGPISSSLTTAARRPGNCRALKDSPLSRRAVAARALLFPLMIHPGRIWRLRNPSTPCAAAFTEVLEESIRKHCTPTRGPWEPTR